MGDIRTSDFGGIPYGDNAGRPANPGVGKLYSNGETSRLEVYTQANGWQNIVQETPAVVNVVGAANENASSTITINGTNFAVGCIAYAVGTNGVETQATTTTLVSVVELTATFSALSPTYEPYDIKVVNPSNLYGILYDTLTVDNIPAWITTSGSIGTYIEQSPMSVALSAIDPSDSSSSPLIYSITSGSLPGGLSINSATGLISGTPADVIPNTTYSFTAAAYDGRNPAVTRNFSITITDRGPSWTTAATLSSFTRNSAYSTTVLATDDNGIASYSLFSGSLPTGLTLNSSTGVISGTPTGSTSATFTIRATDNGGNFADRQFTISNVGPTWSTSTTLPNADVNIAYSTTLVATDDSGVAPTYSVVSGSLPSGLSFNSSTAVISGTPTAAGTFTYTVRATDANGSFADRSFQLVSNPPIGGTAYVTPGTYSWTAPSGVTSICLVGVGGGGRGGDGSGNTSGEAGTTSFNNQIFAGGGQNGGSNENTITPGGTWSGGDGGGNGGYGTPSTDWGGGGGGAGGYSGNGGNGGSGDVSAFPAYAIAGTAGSGGGGGGGASGDGGAGTYGGGGGGGGVGIYGQGTSGAAGTSLRQAGFGGSGGTNGQDGTVWANAMPNPSGGTYGGGGGGTGNQGSGGGGGALVWKNNISVTPGQTYSIVVGAGSSQGPGSPAGGAGRGGALRIIWGANRSFPSTNVGQNYNGITETVI